MKKVFISIVVLLACFASGCSIDYTSYNEKYGNPESNKKEEQPISKTIEEGTLHYPYVNDSMINKYGEVFSLENNNYKVYATYYSEKYDTLYISYDNKYQSTQTIKSKELAMIEEHLLNYFISNEAKSDYHEYLKVVRIYPDYKSSACRKIGESEDSYSKTEGCADYNAYDAAINLNGLVSIDRFFNSYSYSDEHYTYTLEPKRDTFAHEFGHVSTYYHMILKGDGTYEDYLRLRLKNAFDLIYPFGFPNNYSSGEGYYTQPVEILADDYVELYYDVSKKASTDYYQYDLSYNDLRNSLSGVNGVSKFLKDDENLYNAMKEYYDVFIEKDYTKYDDPVVIKASGITYNTIHDIGVENYISLNDATLIALGEVKINDNSYYRVILSNVVVSSNSRSEYSTNIGYILKTNCVIENQEVIYFTRYDGEAMKTNEYLPVSDDVNLYPYYDFSYFIVNGDRIRIYNYTKPGFSTLEFYKSLFI